jgi:hypothetical protein
MRPGYASGTGTTSNDFGNLIHHQHRFKPFPTSFVPLIQDLVVMVSGTGKNDPTVNRLTDETYCGTAAGGASYCLDSSRCQTTPTNLLFSTRRSVWDFRERLDTSLNAAHGHRCMLSRSVAVLDGELP